MYREMSLAELFEMVGAPLANPEWSWGSVRADGMVVLIVWLGEIKGCDGLPIARISYAQAPAELRDSPGVRERHRHVDLIQAGAPSFLVIGEAVDPRGIPRAVRWFNQKFLYEGGSVREIDGDTWIQLGRQAGPARVKREGAT